MRLLRRIILLIFTLVSLCILLEKTYAVDLKVNTVTVNSSTGTSGGWVSVTFPSSFSTVPVVVLSPTSENAEPASVRIRNVTTEGFEALVVESAGTDGSTAEMTVDYFAAESGSYTFAGAVRIEVGTITTTTQQGRNVSPTGWELISYTQSFSTPAILTQIQTVNSQTSLDAGIQAEPWLEVAVDDVTSTGFDLALERSESSSGSVTAETIGYIIMESETEATLEGETFRALRTSNSIRGWNDGCFSSDFASSFSSRPLTIVSTNSRNGADGGWARRCSLSASSVGITIDEDVDDDSDRSHTNESAGVLAISGTFFGTRNGKDLAAGQFTIPSGATASSWTNVVFSTPFASPPAVFALNRAVENDPSEVRLRNIQATGFEISLVKPNGEVGAASETDIDYVAASPGVYAMGNGDLFEIGTVQTSAVQGSVGATGWQDLDFSTAFSSAPALITQIQTTTNEPSLDPSNISSPWLTVTSRNLSASSVQLALETAQTTSGTISSSETIAYFAVENNARGTIDNNDGSSIGYEMLLSSNDIEGWDNGCFNTSFAGTYSSPILIASQVTRDGSDGGWIRRCALSSDQVGLTVDEDRDRDSERSHTTEQAGIFVFGGALDADLLLLDHFEIAHSGQGVTCEAERVTISAHGFYHQLDDDHTATIRVSATSSSAGWSADDANWSIASAINPAVATGPGYIDYTFANGESQIELWLSNTSAAEIDIDIVDLNNPDITDIDDGGSEDPLLSFSDSGFRFYADADADGDADATNPIQSPLTAGVESGQMILRAVETDTETGACVGRVMGNNTVSMAYECVNPSSCVRDNDLEISGVAISQNNALADTEYTDVALSFDNDGEAPFTLRYFDSGQIRLHAAFSLSASEPDPEFDLLGSSDTTTVKPADLSITDISSLSAEANPGTTSSGDGFVSAGEPFSITVEARGATGTITPNFGRETGTEEGITVSIVSLTMPSGGNLGLLSSASSFTATSTLGQFENNAVSWNEVGTITLRAEIADSDFLGSGNVVGTTSSNVGRFFPAEFSHISSSVSNGCASGSFTYMSDLNNTYTPVDITYEIHAISSNGDTVSNYGSGYPVSNFDLVSENLNNGSDISSRIIFDSSTATWTQGQLELSGSDNAGFYRLDNSGAEAIDGPYTNVKLGLKVSTDAIDQTQFNAAELNLNTETTGDCSTTSSCTSIELNGELNTVFGRLWGSDAFGPESSALPVKLYTQFWNGTFFERNTTDNCSSFFVEDIFFAENDLQDDSNREVQVGGGSSVGSFTSYNLGNSINMISGDAGLQFSAPGATNTGGFYVSVNLDNYPWLRFDWNQDGNNNNNLPAVEVSFGSYRGHDRIIFWQEVLTN